MCRFEEHGRLIRTLQESYYPLEDDVAYEDLVYLQASMWLVLEGKLGLSHLQGEDWYGVGDWKKRVLFKLGTG